MEVIHPDHREPTRAAWLAAARSEQPYEVEFPCAVRTGSTAGSCRGRVRSGTRPGP